MVVVVHATMVVVHKTVVVEVHATVVVMAEHTATIEDATMEEAVEEHTAAASVVQTT